MEPFAGGGKILTPVSHVVFALGAGVDRVRGPRRTPPDGPAGR
jgi:hypothetical protein